MPIAPAVTHLKALADPTRLRLLDLLQDTELTVGELTRVLGMTQSRVSGHLGVLREVGLVRDRRQGTSAFYAMTTEGPAQETYRALRSTMPEGPLDPHDRTRLAQVLRKRQERSREFFDRAAGSWDEDRSESLGRHAGLHALAGLLPRDQVVLDLGTGTGGLLPLLGRYVNRLVAVDMSPGMLERARGRGAGDAALIRADVERLPVATGGVDGVVANMVLHHLADPPRALAETARVLGPGGRGVIIDFEAHDESWLMDEEGHRWPGFAPAQIAGWCVDTGLTMPRFERVPTPDSGRWHRLEVFAARFERAAR